MSVFDYHRRVLSPEVWKSDETTLAPKARKQLQYQLRRRFPKAAGVYLLGELTSHYYDEFSPLDVIIRASPQDIEKYTRQAHAISGYVLENTSHAVQFYVLPSSLDPQGIAEFFGALYDMPTQTWIGRRAFEVNQMAQPENVLQNIRWQLYKVKDVTEEPYPRDWRLIREAFVRMGTDQREQVLARLQETADQLYRNVMEVLYFEPPPTWRGASELEDTFAENPSDHALFSVLEKHPLPDFVVGAMFNRFRYLDVLRQLGKEHTMLVEEAATRVEDGMPRIQMVASEGSPREIRYQGTRYVKVAARTRSE